MIYEHKFDTYTVLHMWISSSPISYVISLSGRYLFATGGIHQEGLVNLPP